jgi:metallo-beta-lactamase class B
MLRSFAALAALLLAGSAPAAPPAPALPEADKAALLAACDGKDGWRDPAPPARIEGNVFYVGTCGITALLITSPQGHVLIDSAEQEAVPLILANVRRLGFEPRDIRWLLASHAHFDHTGGHAAMQRATGARIAALPDQARELESGAVPRDDPQHGLLGGIAPVKVDVTLSDGVPLRIGRNRITPFATPGHTRGSTSWVIRACSARQCPAVVYADSTSAVSAEGYRFTDHPEWVARFRRGVARIGTLPCSILITPHPAASQLFARFAGEAPLVDPAQCRRYADIALGRLDERLARERAAR